MILTHLLIIYLIKNKKKMYIFFISLKFGWSLLKTNSKLLYFYMLAFNKEYPWKMYITISNKKKANNLLGFLLYYKKIIRIYGTGYKLNKYKTYFYLRNGVSHKHLMIAIQNINLFLIKKVVFKLQSRKLQYINNFLYYIRKVSNKNAYKKKGIFLKNEINFIKLGKIVKN